MNSKGTALLILFFFLNSLSLSLLLMGIVPYFQELYVSEELSAFESSAETIALLTLFLAIPAGLFSDKLGIYSRSPVVGWTLFCLGGLILTVSNELLFFISLLLIFFGSSLVSIGFYALTSQLVPKASTKLIGICLLFELSTLVIGLLIGLLLGETFFSSKNSELVIFISIGIAALSAFLFYLLRGSFTPRKFFKKPLKDADMLDEIGENRPIEDEDEEKANSSSRLTSLIALLLFLGVFFPLLYEIISANSSAFFMDVFYSSDRLLLVIMVPLFSAVAIFSVLIPITFRKKVKPFQLAAFIFGGLLLALLFILITEWVELSSSMLFTIVCLGITGYFVYSPIFYGIFLTHLPKEKKGMWLGTYIFFVQLAAYVSARILDVIDGKLSRFMELFVFTLIAALVVWICWRVQNYYFPKESTD